MDMKLAQDMVATAQAHGFTAALVMDDAMEPTAVRVAVPYTAADGTKGTDLYDCKTMAGLRKALGY